MKIAFIQSLFYEYLGVMYLSACLKQKGHKVEVFIPDSSIEKFVQEIIDFKPDVIGFSIMTGSQKWAINISRLVKEKIKVYTILGGPHPTFFPEIIDEEGIDAICIGESEESLLEIVTLLSKGQTPQNVLGARFNANGKIFKNELPMLEQNLEKYPYPDRSLYRSKYPSLRRSREVFIAGRGCPFDCTFCFNNSLKMMYKSKGKYVRFRQVNDVIKEIKETIKINTVKTIYFQDDTFILKKKWVLEFMSKYKNEVALPFICLVRADLIDEEVISSLAEANCKSVFFGVESGVENTRNVLLKKKLTNEQIIKFAQLLKKYNIKFRTYNILGFPGETLEDGFKTVKLNSEIKTDFPWCSIFQPYPKTELAEYAKKFGKIDEEAMLSSSSFFKDSVLQLENKNEMINLQKLFFYAVKFPFLIPIIRKVIKLRPNPIFELLFLIGYGWSYMLSERVGLKELFIVGKMNAKRLFRTTS